MPRVVLTRNNERSNFPSNFTNQPTYKNAPYFSCIVFLGRSGGALIISYDQNHSWQSYYALQ
jgi:hypothetical protein